MPAILPEAFPIHDAHELTALSRPSLHLFQVIVGSVMVLQPGSLARMRRQHLPLTSERLGDVNDDIWFHDSALAIPSHNRVHVIQVRNGIQWIRRRLARSSIVGRRRSETG